MYEEINDFLNKDTWHTWHPCDMERFYTSLSKIVNKLNFNSADLEKYMLRKVGITNGIGQIIIEDYENNQNYKNIEKLTLMAEAIHEYLSFINK